ncbi:Transmembrane protein 53, partial [Conglomerata obtusa]
IIMGVGWKGYEGLDQHDYKHYIINHTFAYQRSQDDLSIHTNTIEGNWRSIKEL